MEYIDSGSRNSFHSKGISSRNEQLPARRTRTRMDDQKKHHIDTERHPQKNSPKQLQNPNPPTYDVENINSTNRESDLQFANKSWIVPWRTESMPQKIQSHRRNTLHKSAHPQRDQDQTEESSYGLNWLQKGIWYSPPNLDNKLPQNVQNIEKTMKTWKVELTEGWKAEQKWRSKEVYFKDTNYHRYYS